MLDVLFMAQIAWCMAWLGTRPPIRALLHTAGIVMAAFAASQFSGWLATFLAPPSSTAFLWLERQIRTDTQSVSQPMTAFLPPQTAAVATSAGLHQWIAYSVLRAFLLILMTAAIYSVFLIVNWLLDALWDRAGTEPQPHRYGFTSICYSSVAGLVVAGLTAYGLIHAAWLHGFQGLVDLSGQSAGVHGLEQAVNWARMHQV